MEIDGRERVYFWQRRRFWDVVVGLAFTISLFDLVNHLTTGKLALDDFLDAAFFGTYLFMRLSEGHDVPH